MKNILTVPKLSGELFDFEIMMTPTSIRMTESKAGVPEIETKNLFYNNDLKDSIHGKALGENGNVKTGLENKRLHGGEMLDGGIRNDYMVEGKWMKFEYNEQLFQIHFWLPHW